MRLCIPFRHVQRFATVDIERYFGAHLQRHFQKRWIVAMGTTEGDEKLKIRRLRKHPGELREAVAELRLVQKLVAKSVLQAPLRDRSMTLRQKVIASRIALGAHRWIVLHELAHALGMRRPVPPETELACDLFASTVLKMTERYDEVTALGALLAANQISLSVYAQFNELIVVDGYRRKWVGSHPMPMDRKNQMVNILSGKDGVVGTALPTLDPLLDVPMRLFEEEAFSMETRQAIAVSIAEGLARDLGKQGDPKENVALANELCVSFLSMPNDEPEALTTFQIRDGKPGRVVRVNILNGLAFLAALGATAASGGTAIAIGFAIVGAVCTIGSIFEKPTKAEGAIVWALYKLPQATAMPDVLRLNFEQLASEMPDVDPKQFDVALHSLEKRGMIERTNGSLRLTETLDVFWM